MTYLNHHTINTGHNRKSYRREVSTDTLKLLKPWIEQLQNGQDVQILDLPYFVSLQKSNQSYALYAISTTDREIIRFAVCSKSKHAKLAWQWCDPSSTPPTNYAPFLCVRLNDDNLQADDLAVLPMLADLERCIAWAWIDSTKVID